MARETALSQPPLKQLLTIFQCIPHQPPHPPIDPEYIPHRPLIPVDPLYNYLHFLCGGMAAARRPSLKSLISPESQRDRIHVPERSLPVASCF